MGVAVASSPRALPALPQRAVMWAEALGPQCGLEPALYLRNHCRLANRTTHSPTPLGDSIR